MSPVDLDLEPSGLVTLGCELREVKPAEASDHLGNAGWVRAQGGGLHPTLGVPALVWSAREHGAQVLPVLWGRKGQTLSQHADGRML